MKSWEETVMSDEQIHDSIYGESPSANVGVVHHRGLAKAQAHITWDARELEIEQARKEGMREVAEWIKEYAWEDDKFGGQKMSFFFARWQAQLKKWQV